MIALTFLILNPAFGQDGPPAGYGTSVAAAPASSAAAAKTAPAVKVKNQKAETSPKPQTSAKASDAPEKAGDPPKADAPKLTGVAAQCANLLNLAKTLKTEVDKTTQDVLSVAVVRDATEIQRMAHKMRDDQKH